MAPFDTARATSYKSAIVSIGLALSCTIFQLFEDEEYRDLEISIRLP